MTGSDEGDDYTHKLRDRTQIFPSHDGPNVLPNSPFFTKLLRHAHRRRVAVRDRNHGDISKTYGELLADALALRLTLERRLSSETLVRLKSGDEIFVGILAAGGYDFTVAIVAVLAIGAAVVPMSESDVSIKKRWVFGSMLIASGNRKSTRRGSLLCDQG